VNETANHLQKRLATEGEKIASFFMNLVETEWSLAIYNDESKWTLLHILKHFVSVEQAFQWLIQDVLDGGTGAPQDFVIDEFNEAEVGRFSEYQPVDMVRVFQSSLSIWSEYFNLCGKTQFL
jgi:hypothetical protein